MQNWSGLTSSKFALRLVDLANDSLLVQDKFIVIALIDFLIDGMNKGNSCIYLSQFIDYYHEIEINNQLSNDVVEIKPQLDIDKLFTLLKQSGLCVFVEMALLISVLQSKTTSGKTPNWYSQLLANNNSEATNIPLVVIVDNANYPLTFARYFAYELYVINKFSSLASKTAFTPKLIEAIINQLTLTNTGITPNSEQQLAIINSALTRLSFISGGPGTGKTTTVFMLLVTLMRAYSQLSSNSNSERLLNIQIVAPTGKAVGRLKESIAEATFNGYFELNEQEQQQLDRVNYTTIHRLLGYLHNSIYFKYNQANQLKTDILIIDESSMISLPLMYKLLMALDLSTIKHIIFLGDKNQLSSVEEGYVFAALTSWQSAPTPSNAWLSSLKVSQLTISNRNIGDINRLATAVLAGNASEMVSLLTTSQTAKLYDYQINNVLDWLAKSDYFNAYIDAINDCDGSEVKIQQLVACFKQSITLCATNAGQLGVNNINSVLDNLVKERLNELKTWYTGRPILILENNVALDIYNGDIGICVITADKLPLIYFDNGKHYAVEVLPSNQLAYVITIHKAQGSEYNHVNVILPELSTSNSQLFSRELLYTAITRAKNSVAIFANANTLNYAITNKTARYSILETILHS
jgi:exodeoxyribonuclease V alpha subunit